MPLRIHYDDNIAFLSGMIRSIRQGAMLDIDAEFFAERVLDELLFVDATLVRLDSLLRGAEQLISRNEHLRALLRCERSYVSLLTDLENDELAFGAALSDSRARLGAVRRVHEENARRLDLALRQPADDMDEQRTVGSDELRLLLRGDSEDSQD